MPTYIIERRDDISHKKKQKRTKRTKEVQSERDDSMATVRRNAFVVRASMFDKFAKETNKKDIENIYAMAEKFEKAIKIKKEKR